MIRLGYDKTYGKNRGSIYLPSQREIEEQCAIFREKKLAAMAEQGSPHREDYGIMAIRPVSTILFDPGHPVLLD